MHQLRTPELEPGLIALQVDDRGSTALHEFVAAARTAVEGTLYWLDAGNTASAYVINQVFARRHRRGNFRVARAFTAYQHVSLVRNLVETATARTGMAVVPNVAALYQDDDVPAYEDTRLFESSLSVLREFAVAYDVPVVVTAPRASADHRTLVDEVTAATVTCEETEFGRRFAGADFETTVYRDRGGWQTTIPYWVDLLGVGDDPLAPASERGLGEDPPVGAPEATPDLAPDLTGSAASASSGSLPEIVPHVEG